MQRNEKFMNSGCMKYSVKKFRESPYCIAQIKRRVLYDEYMYETTHNSSFELALLEFPSGFVKLQYETQKIYFSMDFK